MDWFIGLITVCGITVVVSSFFSNGLQSDSTELLQRQLQTCETQLETTTDLFLKTK